MWRQRSVDGDGDDGDDGVCEVVGPFFCGFLMDYCYCCCCYSLLPPPLPPYREHPHLHPPLCLRCLLLLLFSPCASSLYASFAHVADFPLNPMVSVTEMDSALRAEGGALMFLLRYHPPPLKWPSFQSQLSLDTEHFPSLLLSLWFFFF